MKWKQLYQVFFANCLLCSWVAAELPMIMPHPKAYWSIETVERYFTQNLTLPATQSYGYGITELATAVILSRSVLDHAAPPPAKNFLFDELAKNSPSSAFETYLENFLRVPRQLLFVSDSPRKDVASDLIERRFSQDYNPALPRERALKKAKLVSRRLLEIAHGDTYLSTHLRRQIVIRIGQILDQHPDFHQDFFEEYKLKSTKLLVDAAFITSVPHFRLVALEALFRLGASPTVLSEEIARGFQTDPQGRIIADEILKDIEKILAEKTARIEAEQGQSRISMPRLISFKIGTDASATKTSQMSVPQDQFSIDFLLSMQTSLKTGIVLSCARAITM